MSDVVKEIIDAAEVEIQTALGASYQKLSYYHDILLNDFVRNKKRFGFIPEDSVDALSVNKFYTVDHNFQVVITDNYKNVGNNDKNQRDVRNALFEKMHEVASRLIYKKLGLPAKVNKVDFVGNDTPEYIEEHNVVVIRGNFVIKYRVEIIA